MFELNDYERVELLTPAQFREWQKLTTIQNNALWRIAESVTLLKDHLKEVIEIATADNGKWQSIQNETMKAGFASMAEAIAKIQIPRMPGPPARVESVKFIFPGLKETH